MAAVFAGAGAELPPRSGPTLTDFWNGHATWTASAGGIGRGFGFHFLSITEEQRELRAYFISNHNTANGKTKSAVGRARSTDGINWTNDGIVMDVGGSAQTRAWDDRLASFPGAWKDGDTWYLVYEGAAEDIPFSPGDIGLATSRDGRNFVKHPGNPILRHNPGGWERTNIGTPSLYKENGRWYLFYHGFDGTRVQIGVASGASLTKLVKSPSNPILATAYAANGWDAGTVGKRSRIVKENGFYYFAYEGSTVQNPSFHEARWSSGLARSTNLISDWTKFSGNPILPATPIGFGNDGPELARIGGDWFLYVRTPGTNGPTRRYQLAPR